LQRLKELDEIDFEDVAGSGMTKKELLHLRRERDKLDRSLGGIKDMARTPSALWVVDTKKEHIAVSEARKLGIPVIASLNCVSHAGWVDYARGLEQAGADAIELNIYFIPADTAMTGRDVEQRYLDILAAVKASVSIPVAVKIGPYFSAIGAMARALADAGAGALVLFNRFYQPDMDIATLRLSMDLQLSTPAEIRLPLLWIAILHRRVPVSLAASTGVESADEVFKYLLAGADTVMTTSSLLRHGVRHMRTLLDGLSALLVARDIESLDEIRGCMSQQNLKDPTAFERANYVQILQGYHVLPAT